MNSGISWAGCASCIALLLVGTNTQVNNPDPNQPAPSTAKAKLLPGTLDFGKQSVGTSISPKTATLSNVGTQSLTVTDIATSGIDYSQTNNCGKSLTPGASCEIQVTFKPAITGPRVATLQILDSDPSTRQSIVLNGTGQ